MLFFSRRRRKRRDQTCDGKPDRPDDFNLPRIPHCYSTAASYAASSLSHKFGAESLDSTASYDGEVAAQQQQQQRAEETARTLQQADHSQQQQQQQQQPFVQHNTAADSNRIDTTAIHHQTPAMGSHEQQPAEISPSQSGHINSDGTSVDGMLSQHAAMAQYRSQQSQQRSTDSNSTNYRDPHHMQQPQLPEERTLTGYAAAAAACFTNTSGGQSSYPGHQGVTSGGDVTGFPSHFAATQRSLNFSVNDLIHRTYPRM